MKLFTQILAIAVTLLCSLATASLAQKTSELKSSSTSTKDTSPVLVRVNGTPITESDLSFFVKTRKLSTDDAEERRDVLIERLIERQLLRGFLTQKKITASPVLLDDHVIRLKQRLKAGSADPEQLLLKAGFTDETLRRELRLPLDWDAYIKLIATDAKVSELWKQRKQEFDGTEVRAAQIAFKSANPDADEMKLDTIRNEITSKRITFKEAAKKHSQAPSADNGGDLGLFGFRSGRVTPELVPTAFGLKVGDISPPFRSSLGVHLLTVTERIEGQLSLEDAKPEIRQQMSIELQQETLKAERAKAKIEKN
ncbi:MAG: peptidylprolyl isomerase [Planctomycetia bacterium]|nr:peptidylprolyl isomerase [Planctomycetia bacterium]